MILKTRQYDLLCTNYLKNELLFSDWNDVIFARRNFPSSIENLSLLMLLVYFIFTI